MMKKSVFWSIFLIPFLFTASCRDTPEKLMEDIVVEMNEVCNALEDYEKGKISEQDIIEKIKRYKSNLKKISERREELKKQGHFDKKTQLDPQIEKELEASYTKYHELIMRIALAGKNTPAFDDAVSEKVPFGLIRF